MLSDQTCYACLFLPGNGAQAAQLGCIIYHQYSRVKTTKDMMEKQLKKKNEVKIPPGAQVVVRYQKTDPEHEQ